METIESFEDMYWRIQKEFDICEKSFKERFSSPYKEMKKYNGMKFTILRRCSYVSDDWDLECLPAWHIILENGDKIEALPEEICDYKCMKGINE